MARLAKAIVDYFSHDTKHGKTLFTIEQKYGNDGYAFWFKLLELLGSTENHYYNCNDISNWEYLQAITRFDEEKAKNILETLAKLNAINAELWELKIIRSDNFIKNLDQLYKRRSIDVITNDAVKDLCIHQFHSEGFMSTSIPLNGVNVNIKQQSKVKESIVDKSKVKETSLKDESDFDKFWNLYDKKKDRKKCETKWKNLRVKDKEAIFANLSEYVKSTPDKEFRKNPATYINGECWNDEIIKYGKQGEIPEADKTWEVI